MIHIQEFLNAENAAKKLLEIAKIKKEYYKMLEDFDVESKTARHAALTLDFGFVYESDEFSDEEKEQVRAWETKHKQLIGLSQNQLISKNP